MSLSFRKINLDDFEVADNLDKNNKSFIYGEVSHQGLSDILERFNMDNYRMLDVGSGCGKIVIYISTKFNINVDGIEIDINRYEKSQNLLELFNLFDRVHFFNDSFKNIYFGDYDIIYCCNLVFEEEDNNILYKKIRNEFTGMFILFEYDHTLIPFYRYKEKIKTSWNKSVDIFIFEKY
jgi:tRNA G46 methylase TrmB